MDCGKSCENNGVFIIDNVSDNTQGINVSSNGVSEKIPENIHEPPDGGWGWLVCLTSFCANGIAGGVINTFGITFAFMLKEFDSNDPNIAFKTCKYKSDTLPSHISSIAAMWDRVKTRSYMWDRNMFQYKFKRFRPVFCEVTRSIINNSY